MFRADVSRAWLRVPDAGLCGTLSLSEQVQQHPALCHGMRCSARGPSSVVGLQVAHTSLAGQ